ncbi:unnamed protein product, partial [Mesorhabditis spiculigera]
MDAERPFISFTNDSRAPLVIALQRYWNVDDPKFRQYVSESIPKGRAVPMLFFLLFIVSGVSAKPVEILDDIAKLGPAHIERALFDKPEIKKSDPGELKPIPALPEKPKKEPKTLITTSGPLSIEGLGKLPPGKCDSAADAGQRLECERAYFMGVLGTKNEKDDEELLVKLDPDEDDSVEATIDV